MKISCVIVSYNNGRLLEEAIMSVVRQSRPADEIIVADDASTDGSPKLIEALADRYVNIRPVFRERNLGVGANRDLAMREARGDFVTWLDGDDYFRPRKLELEAQAAMRERQGVVAYSDVTIVDRRRHRVRTASIGEFSQLGAPARIRWLLTRDRQSPRSMLIPRTMHQRIGGFNHHLPTYEDWDYTLRLAAQSLRWVHSGTEGLVHHLGGGLSRQSSLLNMHDELHVILLNRQIARELVGFPTLIRIVGRVIAVRTKWWIVPWYWRKKGWTG
jgi:glycosyltransferase involved in cell wall biosynthesis